MINITKVRVVTSFFINDIIASIQNFFGMRINKYEDMILNAKQEIFDELEEEDIILSWYRFEISQLTNGAMVIMLYGDTK